MLRALVLLLTLASCLSAAHAGYWRLVDTRVAGKQAPANDMFVNRVSGSSSGAVLETALPASSSHQDRGKALVSKAGWSIPPDALAPGQKHFWQVELGATRAELGSHWHIEHAITLAECRTQPGEPGVGCGGHRPIASTTIHTAGARVLNNRASGEWIVPTGAANGKLWLVADFSPALFRVIYSYVWAEGSAPKTAGAGSSQPGAPGGADPGSGSALPGTGGQPGAAGSGAAGRSDSGTSVTLDGPRSGGAQGEVADGVAGGAEVEIFNNGNLSGVDNKGTPPDFTLPRAARISSVLTYHYNHGRGAPGGSIQILGEDGTRYGPWRVEVKNQVYWIARPNVLLPAGRYRVIDSDPATWSQNSASGGAGHTIIKGYWGGGGSAPPVLTVKPASRPVVPIAQPADTPAPGALAIAGNWKCPEGVCTIRQHGEQLTFSKGKHSSTGAFKAANRNRVVARDWAGMEGRLSSFYQGSRMAASEAKDRFGLEPGEIRWADGSVWSR